MSNEEREAAGARVRRRLCERGFELDCSGWPRIDWETMELYWPGERYLERLFKERRRLQGEALMRAVRGVVAEERSGAWD